MEDDEFFDSLQGQGWKAEACTLPVPFYCNRPSCGIPIDIGDEAVDDYYLFPRSMAQCGMTFSLKVKGDSMIEAGINDGDMLILEATSEASSGQIVLASVDGEYVVKVFYCDAYGHRWLIPRNPHFQPICITEGMNVHIHGRAIQQTKDISHLRYEDMEALVRPLRPKRQVKSEKSIRSFMTQSNDNEARIRVLDSLMRGHKGKRAALAIACAMELGWFADKPTFTSVVESFGVVGNKDAYNRQMRRRNFLSKEEKEPFLEALKI